jgi:hypothetical protein
MHELIENMKGALDTWGELTEVLLNAFSLICIINGYYHFFSPKYTGAASASRGTPHAFIF